jgi:hypothetical protein
MVKEKKSSCRHRYVHVASMCWNHDLGDCLMEIEIGSGTIKIRVIDVKVQGKEGEVQVSKLKESPMDPNVSPDPQSRAGAIQWNQPTMPTRETAL